MKKTAIVTALGFPSLILLGFILCMHPFAEARQGWSLEEDDFTILAADIEVIPIRKEVAESIHHEIAAASALGFGGRKMMAAKVDEQTLNGGFLDQKKHKNILGPKPPLISASSYNIVQAVHSPTIQDSSATAIDGEEEPMTITEAIMVEKKKKKLLEDSVEDEIVKLMHKDYGQGPPKPKRKPPINNHEPVH